MPDDPSDPSLDAQLRGVPIPPDLAERVKAALAPTDEQLDARLRDVAVPAVALARLHEIPDDVALDESLADVAHPFTLARSLRKTSPVEHLRRAGRSLVRMSVAASWFVAIYASLTACVLVILGTVFAPPEVDEFEAVAIYDGPLSVTGQQADVVTIDSGEGPGPGSPSGSGNLRGQFATLPVGLPDVSTLPKPGPVGEWNALVAGGLRPMDDIVLLRFGVLGSPDYTDDRLPELDPPLALRPSGLVPPLVRSFNRPFFVKHGVYPPVQPTRPELARLKVPLVVGSDLVSRLERSLAEGRAPAESELTVEDLVAGLDYHYAAAPAGRLAIRTAAGPAIFAPQGAGLLQIGVQAGGFASRHQPSTHLVLAIDLSHSMCRAGRLEMVQQGINRLFEQLGPDDRLSLVIFDEQVIHRVELATRDDVPALRQLLKGLVLCGGTNLAAGLQQAASLAMSPGARPDGAQRLVLITDSTGDMPAGTLDQVRQLLAAARDAGVRMNVLDVSERATVDPLLAEWAQNMGGESRPVRTSRQMAWSLLDALAGQSPIVASEARLAIQFNPQVVAAYRLVGHETSALTSLKPASLEAEIAVGEAATTLVEIWFQPGDADDLGYAELTWHDAENKEQRVRQRISRLQFSPTLDQSAISLQEATIAAEIGQQLRGTREALREVGLPPVTSRGMADVLSAARGTHPQLRQREDFQRLLRVTQALDK